MTKPDRHLWKCVYGPAWRVAYADTLSNRHMQGKLNDPPLEDLLDYLRQSCADPNTATLSSTLTAAAFLIQDQSPLVDGLKFLSLAGATVAQIAKRTGLTSDVIGHWQSLFFDISGMATASVWLHAHVLEPARRADPRLHSRMRLALGSGLPAADALLDAEIAFATDGPARQRQRQLRLQLRIDEGIDHLERSASQDAALVRAWQKQAMRPTAPGRRPLPKDALLQLQWANASSPNARSTGSVASEQIVTFPTAPASHRPPDLLSA